MKRTWRSECRSLTFARRRSWPAAFPAGENHQRGALDAICRAELIIIGRSSFFTSLMPLMLLPDFTKAINFNQAPMIHIENLGKELSPAAASSA